MGRRGVFGRRFNEARARRPGEAAQPHPGVTEIMRASMRPGREGPGRHRHEAEIALGFAVLQ